jgi:BirA family biotin operon repressor/biotin-[acetyl-CoA-carboxylase] ligase
LQHKPVIKPLGSSFIELNSADSTNNYALSSIREGVAQHGIAFFAHEQTGGKGQMGRQWISEKGANIALSIVLQPKPLQVSQQFQLSACIAVAAFKFFSHYAGIDTRIKWPNDLYWQDKKAGGILIESIIQNQQSAGNGQTVTGWKWAVAGIGININQTRFTPELPNPVSLKQITGKDFNPAQLAKELCGIADEQFRQLTNDGFTGIYKEYNDCLYKKNEKVKLKKNNTIFSAIVKEVSPTGELIADHDGRQKQYKFGDISWVI